MGKRDDQIKKIVNLLNDNREDWIKEYEKSGCLILNAENPQITSKFSDFLNYRIIELIRLKKISTNNEILREVIIKFKKELLSYLLKKKDHNILCEVKFRDGYSLFNVFKALRYFNDICIFRIKAKEIHAYLTNKSKTYLIDIVLKTKDSQFFLINQLDILIKLDPLLKCLECNKNENIITSIQFKEDKVEIDQTSPTLKSKITRVINEIKTNFDKENTLDKLLELEFLGKFVIDKNKFIHITSQAGRFSEGIIIEVSNDFIHILDNDYEGKSCIRWDKNDLHKLQVKSYKQDDTVSVYISVENLRIVLPFLFEDFSLLKFNINPEIPIKISFDFKTLEKSYGAFFLAQRDSSAYE